MTGSAADTDLETMATEVRDPIVVQPHRSLWWVVAPGLALATVLALSGLDRQALWLDEAYSLGATNQLGRTLSNTSGTMAGYYLALWAWTSISDSVWWLRAMSVLAASSSLVVVGALARRLVGADLARLTVLVSGLSYLWLVYAREARSYAMVMLFTSVAWLALERAVTSESPTEQTRWWAAHSLLVTLMPLLHGLTILSVLPQVALVAFVYRDRTSLVRVGRGAVGSLAVTGLLLSVGAGEVGNWMPPLDVHQVWTLLTSLFSPFGPFALALFAGAAWTSVVVARRALSSADPTERFRRLVPVVWAVGAPALLLCLSVVRPSLVPRYVIGSVPGLALLAAAGIDLIPVGRPDIRRLATFGLVAMLMVGSFSVHGEPTDGWTASTRLVASESQAGDSVLFPSPADRPPFEAAWRDRGDGSVDLVGLDRPLGEVRRFEDLDPGVADLVTDAAAMPGRIWVVGEPTWPEMTEVLDDLTGPEGTHHEVERWSDLGDVVTVVLVEHR